MLHPLNFFPLDENGLCCLATINLFSFGVSELADMANGGKHMTNLLEDLLNSLKTTPGWSWFFQGLYGWTLPVYGTFI